MDKKRKTRYLVAIYMILAFIAIILALLAFRRSGDAWQSILLNLSTELLGVVFVFLLVNYFFMVDEWSLADRVQQLISQLDFMQTPSVSQVFQEMPTLDAYFDSAKSIDLLGTTLTSTINRHFSKLRELLNNGSQIRTILIDPNSYAIEMASIRSDTNAKAYYQSQLLSAFRDIEYLQSSMDGYVEDSKLDGGFSARVIPYAPSFSIIGVNSSEPDGIIIVELYAHKKISKSVIFVLSPNRDKEWYKYFLDQFEMMWQDAKPWVNTNLVTSGGIDFWKKRIKAQDFFSTEKATHQLDEGLIGTANKIYAVGMSLTRLTRQYMKVLGDRLEDGAHIRFIILDYLQESVLQQIAIRTTENMTKDHWKLRLQNVESMIQALASTPNNNGAIEIGYLPYIPGFGMIILDPDDQNGICTFELYLHKSAKPEATFMIYKEEDPYWFNYFIEQYDILWDSCRVRDLSASQNAHAN